MKAVAPHHYIFVSSPYPAHLFAITHPLWVADMATNRLNQIVREQVTVPMCSLQDDYELTDSLGYLETMGAFK